MSTTTYSYTKTEWVDKEDTEFREGVSPAVNKTNLDHIESALKKDGDGLNDHEDRIINITTKLNNSEVLVGDYTATLSSWRYNNTYSWYECDVSNAEVQYGRDVYFTLANNKKSEYGNMTLLLPESSSVSGFTAAVVHSGIPETLTLYYKVTKVVTLP